MSYVGSHVWKLRQKVGNDLLMTVTVAVLPISQKNEVKLVYANHLKKWTLVGGHAEEGDSFLSAAQNELLEEAGITARKENLTPFAAISGPNRIYHYDDGDTQPFTLAFFVKEWESETDPLDDEEIARTKWVPLSEALTGDETSSIHRLLQAYQAFETTSAFQMIEVNE